MDLRVWIPNSSLFFGALFAPVTTTMTSPAPVDGRELARQEEEMVKQAREREERLQQRIRARRALDEQRRKEHQELSRLASFWTPADGARGYPRNPQTPQPQRFFAAEAEQKKKALREREEYYENRARARQEEARLRALERERAPPQQSPPPWYEDTPSDSDPDPDPDSGDPVTSTAHQPPPRRLRRKARVRDLRREYLAGSAGDNASQRGL